MTATTAQNYHDVTWPAFEAIPAERVISGSPEAATVEVTGGDLAQSGFWRVTPGAFATVRSGYIEYIHILEGTGRLVSDDGEVVDLRPGTSVFIPDGYSGRWEIDTTLSKAYTTVTV